MRFYVEMLFIVIGRGLKIIHGFVDDTAISFVCHAFVSLAVAFCINERYLPKTAKFTARVLIFKQSRYTLTQTYQTYPGG